MELTRRHLILGAAALSATALLPGTPRTPPCGRARARTRPTGWRALPDSRSLLRMTIPGTHDSCCTDPSNGTEWSHTQNWGLTQQLQEGIRFFDIRANGLEGPPERRVRDLPRRLLPGHDVRRRAHPERGLPRQPPR